MSHWHPDPTIGPQVYLGPIKMGKSHKKLAPVYAYPHAYTQIRDRGGWLGPPPPRIGLTRQKNTPLSENGEGGSCQGPATVHGEAKSSLIGADQQSLLWAVARKWPTLCWLLSKVEPERFAVFLPQPTYPSAMCIIILNVVMYWMYIDNAVFLPLPTYHSAILCRVLSYTSISWSY